MDDNIILLRQKSLYAVVKCNKCNAIESYEVGEVNITCKNCNSKNQKAKVIREEATNTFIPIFVKKFKKHKEVIFVALEKDYKDYQYIVKTLQDCRFGLIFEESQGPMPMDIVYCKHCSTCKNCVTCKCGQVFERTKARCPKCKKNNAQPSFIKERKRLSNGWLVCPHCESNLVKSTYYAAGAEKCPRCGSVDRKKPNDSYICRIRRIPMLEMTDNG